MKLLLHLISLLAAAGTALAAHTVIGLSPNLPADKREQLSAQLANYLVGTMQPDDVVDVYDALNLQRIARLTLPADRALSANSMAKMRQLAPALGTVVRFVKQAPAGAALDGALNEPAFLRLVGAQVRTAGEATSILLIGSSLFRDPRERKFDFTEGYFPSDAHLDAGPGASPFSVEGAGPVLDKAAVFHVTIGGTYTCDAHAKAVERFWALYVARLGGMLCGFADDLSTILARARPSGGRPIGAYAPDPGQNKVEMLHCVPQTARDGRDWLTAPLVAGTPPLRSARVKDLSIGVRWKEAVDVDLYASTTGNQDLYFGNARTAEGRHVKDYRTSPAGTDQYETIEFTHPVDVRELRAAVNLYSGKLPPGGMLAEVRVLADGQAYGQTVKLVADSGNGGKGRQSRRSDPHWVELNVAAIVKFQEAH